VVQRRHRYPPEWPAVSRHIRCIRAANHCEWCGAINYQPHPVTGSKVVLTVAHLGVPYPDGSPGNKHNKCDLREENLAALCQRCHLNYDQEDHLAAAARTRERKRMERLEAMGFYQCAFPWARRE
jgi:hypothetical protein